MSLQFWNTQKTVNTNTVQYQYAPFTTQLTDGSIIVCWTEANILAETKDVKFQRFDALGNLLGTETLAHTASPAAFEFASAIVALPNGGFAIAYYDGVAGQVLQKYSAGGVPQGAAIALTDVGGSIFAQSYTALPNGDIAVVYENAGACWLRIVSATGVVGSAIFIPPVGSSPEIAVVGDKLAISHTAFGTTVVELYTFTGVSTGASSGTGSGDRAEDILGLSNGNILVLNSNTATGGGVLKGNIFSGSDLSKFAIDFSVATAAQGSVVYGDATALADGKFAVAYSVQAAGGESLYCQTFNADGSRFGAELRLFSGPLGGFGGGYHVDLITLADGRISATWSAGGIDGDGNGVAMRILDPREGIFEGTAGADKMYGANAGNDYFTGGGGNDEIYGYRGNDTIYGEADSDYIDGGFGDDEIYGGDGVDRLVGSTGADIIDGGAGSDTAFYLYSRNPMTINLVTNVNTGGEADGDLLIGVENIVGSIYAADNITGDGYNNSFYGYAGNDALYGGGGNDTLNGGEGADILDGGSGINTASYSTSAVGVTINLATATYLNGDAQGDTLTNLTSVLGSQSGDSLTGNSSSNTLTGIGGGDFLNGGLGNDTLSGGAGADIYIFDTALNSATNKDTITDFVVADDTIWLENAIFTQLTATGLLAAALFKNLSLAAIDADDRIIYDQATGTLSYDSDGSGAAAAVQFAVLTGSPVIDVADFFVT